MAARIARKLGMVDSNLKEGLVLESMSTGLTGLGWEARVLKV